MDDLWPCDNPRRKKSDVNNDADDGQSDLNGNHK